MRFIAVFALLSTVLLSTVGFAKSQSGNLRSEALCPDHFRQLLVRSKWSQAPPERKLKAGGFVLDTNVLGVLERLQSQNLIRPADRHTLQFLSRLTGVSASDLLNSAKRRVPIYYTPTIVEELKPHREWMRETEYLHGTFMIKPTPHVQKQVDATLDELVRWKVGGVKGDRDRQIVAEVLHAETEPGSLPTLVTGDRGIYERLCLKSTSCAALQKRPGRVVNLPDQFEVTILRRRMIIVPMPAENAANP